MYTQQHNNTTQFRSDEPEQKGAMSKVKGFDRTKGFRGFYWWVCAWLPSQSQVKSKLKSKLKSKQNNQQVILAKALESHKKATFVFLFCNKSFFFCFCIFCFSFPLHIFLHFPSIVSLFHVACASEVECKRWSKPMIQRL